MSPPVAVGAFDLLTPLGRGSAGEVWRARHRRSGADVAIKVLTATEARGPTWRAAFRREVRLLAALDHPAVITVLDAGELGREGAPGLPPGSPWLAMELAAGGTLRAWGGRLPWAAVRDALARLLDGLAHAHGRGVVHLDIKPANVLLGCATRDLGGPAHPAIAGLRLADFSVGARLGEEPAPAVGASVVGTPPFMAPEQLHGWWRDWGPWTDLFAVGALAWFLLCGEAPWPGATVAEQRGARTRPPTWAPLVPVPAGTEAWVRSLLRADPGQRPDRAIDARASLRALGEAAGGPGPAGSRPAADPTTVMLEDLLAEEEEDEGDAETVDDAPSGVARRVPAQLEDAGLGLVDLRAGSLVGRAREREALEAGWAAVRADGRARAMVLRGPVGSGKARLADWLAERVHASGEGEVVRVPAGGRGRLAESLGRWLGAAGLQDAALRAYLHTRLARVAPLDDAWWLDPFAAWVEGAPPAGVPEDVVVAAALAHLGRRRPTLLVVVDAVAAVDAVAVLDRLLRRRDAEPLPLLALLVEPGGAPSALDELGEHEGVAAVSLGPVPSHELEWMLRDLVRLEPDVAAAVASRAAGRPGVALAVVTRAVRAGLVTPGRRGFRLPFEAIDRLAREVGVAAAGLDRVAPDPSAPLSRALEWLAVLGEGAERELAGLDGVEVAEAEGWIDRGGGRWRFVDRGVRDALLARVRAAGLTRPLHRAAALLREGGGAEDAEQAAFHHLEAGDAGRALPGLLAAAGRRRTAGEFRAAARLADALGRAIELGRVRGRRAAEARVEMAEIQSFRSAYGVAETLAAEVLAEAEAEGWLDLAARARWVMGNVIQGVRGSGDAVPWLRRAEVELRALSDWGRWFTCVRTLGWGLTRLGDYDGARRLYTEVIARARALGEPVPEAEASIALADVSRFQGDLDAAATWVERAEVVARTVKNPDLLSWVGACAAQVALLRGETDAAARHSHLALEMARRSGRIPAIAHASNGLGEIARQRGDLDEAARWYEEALRWLDASGSVEPFPKLNLGLVLELRGRFPEARATVEDCLAAADARGEHGLARFAAHGLLTAALAGLGEWTLVEQHLDAAWALARARGIVEPDVAAAAERAATRAAAAGRGGLADRLSRFVAEQRGAAQP